jgi:hypothetical protein
MGFWFMRPFSLVGEYRFSFGGGITLRDAGIYQNTQRHSKEDCNLNHMCSR